MPLLLEAALQARTFRLSPAELGLDVRDPRLLRAMDLALRVYDTACERKGAAKKGEWDKAHPQAKRFLDWARRGTGVAAAPREPSEVTVEVPDRPRRNR